jgi:serine protease
LRPPERERLERAREIADASLKQITGETIVDQADKKDPMRSVPVEARAIAGKVISDISGQPTNKPAFAVLSVIAKPADIPPAETAAEIEGDANCTSKMTTALAEVMAAGRRRWRLPRPPAFESPRPGLPARWKCSSPQVGISPRV